MSRTFLLMSRDPKHPDQVAEACARFTQRTGQKATLLGVKPGAQPPVGADGLLVVEDKACLSGAFWVGSDGAETANAAASRPAWLSKRGPEWSVAK